MINSQKILMLVLPIIQVLVCSAEEASKPLSKTQIKMVNGDTLHMKSNLSEFSRTVLDSKGRWVGYKFKWEPESGAISIYTIIGEKEELLSNVNFGSSEVNRLLNKQREGKHEE